MNDTNKASDAVDDEPVAAILQQLQAGVRQRISELTTVDSAGNAISLALAELQRAEFVQEPLCVSPRPVVGRLLVFSRKAMHKLFVRWYARPVLKQQNQFNSIVATLLRELVEENAKLRRQIDLLRGAREEQPHE